MKFSEVYGYDAIKEKLVNSVKNDKIAHAQLFLGKEGNGQLALALAYATYVNCLDKKEARKH